MPNPSAFLKSFGLVKIANQYGWKATVTSMSHEALVQYRKYDYRFTILLSPTSNAKPAKSMLAVMKQAKSRQPTVKTRYGNPYQCTISSISVMPTGAGKGALTLTVAGKAVRLFGK